MTGTTRVAVHATARAPRYGGGTLFRWVIVEVPTGLLGHRMGEADAVAAALPADYTGFLGDVIVVEDSGGFSAGCSTWSRYRDEHHTLARAEHRDCEHTLFGADPADGWTQETEPGNLDAWCAVERWTYRTVDWQLIVQRLRHDPGRWRLTIRRDEWGPLEDLEDWALPEEYNVHDAKQAAAQTVVESISGL